MPTRQTGPVKRTKGWVLTITVTMIVLVVLGVWRRNDLVTQTVDARADRAAALASLTTLQARIRNTALAARSLEFNNSKTLNAAQDLERSIDDALGRIQLAGRQRDDSAVSAYIAGGQLGQLRECLDGITRALNQVSVGDLNSVGTLEATRPACRAVGA